MMPVNEDLLNQIISGDTADDIVPHSLNEEFLKCCAQGTGCFLIPKTRNQELLKLVANKIAASVSIPEEVATSAEMNALLTVENVGRAYIYTGVTDENYINGDIYVVEEG